MRLPAIALVPARTFLHLGIVVLLTLPAVTLAQDRPNLTRLLFEIAPASESAATAADVNTARDEQAADDAADATTIIDGEASVVSAAANDGESIARNTQASGNDTRASIATYEEAVLELEQTSGPFATGLTERLLALGELYERSGDHEAAIATYEKAVHILRVNDGLFTLDQVPLVQDIIRNYRAMDDYREAGNRQEYLYYVKQKNYDEDHPEMIQAMLDWADWNVQAYYRELEEGANSRFIVTQSVSPVAGDMIPVVGPNNTVYYVPRNQGFNSPYGLNNSFLHAGGLGVQYMMDPRLRTARDLYQDIAERMEGGEDAAAARLPETERKLANISYIVKQEMDTLERSLRSSNFFAGRGFRPEQNPEVSRGYTRGREALEKVLANLQADDGADPATIARAIIDLGDWQLTYERSQAAYQRYREAYAVLNEAGVADADIDAIFAPVPAVEIPTYATHRHSRAALGIPAGADVPYLGYIDVRLDIDRYGNVRRPRVEAMSPGTHNDVREALLDHLRGARMRPGLAAGEAVERENIVLRYYYSY